MLTETSRSWSSSGEASFLLDAPEKTAFRVSDYSTVAGGVFKTNRQHGNCVFLRQMSVGEVPESRALYHWDVAGEDDEGPLTALQFGARGDYRMTCSTLLGLEGELEIEGNAFISPTQALAFSADRLFTASA